MRIDEAGWLVAEQGDPKVSKIAGDRGRTCGLDSGKPLGVVWHWTAGPCKNPKTSENLAKSLSTFDRIKDRAASWHVIISKAGELIQSYTFNVGTWHVGRPGRIGGAPTQLQDGTWEHSGKLFSNVNRCTLGVELENSGELQKIGDSYYCWPFWKNPGDAQDLRVPDSACKIPEERVTAWEGKYFDGYTSAQEDAAQRLLHACIRRYKWKREVCAYAHTHFDWLRKQDPGPLWLDGVLPNLLLSTFGPVP